VGKWSSFKGKLEEPIKGDGKYIDRINARLGVVATRTLDQLTSDFNETREAKDACAKTLKEHEFELEVLTRAIVKRMEDENTESVTKHGYRWTPSPEPYPQVKDKLALRKWVDEFMPDNLSLPAATLEATVKAKLEVGDELPPGVDVFMKTGLSRTSAK
jgi:hypothetical protein